jgi:hypothetical protein
MLVLALSTVIGYPAWGELLGRRIPRPLPDHPGNVFLDGEEVAVQLQSTELGLIWGLYNYEEERLSTVKPNDGIAGLGRLPTGFYRLRAESHSNWISCAVVSPLKVPTPVGSPVGLDVAMSWFYPCEKMDAVSSLCALAGINWVRDRLAWVELESQTGNWAGRGRYDDAALAQRRAGLQILQVNHLSPPWANPTTNRFPLDLRDAYRFYREMARRWRGQVPALEPWNEADIPAFGGHTGAEMAAMQKASYLGLKAGARQAIACLNVFALPNRAQLADLYANEAWPYFDTFNLHHYVPFEEYPRVYRDFRPVSAGRPLWVSECALPVSWTGDEQLKEPTDADLRIQAERVAKTFACSLHEGSANTFYFMLPHYVEGQTQFGLLRPDLTPRPSYVALAAVGRLLADARAVGRLETAQAAVRGFLFRAKPDGHRTTVLVAWTTEGRAVLELPGSPGAVFDHLGRKQEPASSLSLSPAPVFAFLSDTCVKQCKILPPPASPPRLGGKPSPVVLQAQSPQASISLSQSAYRVSSERSESMPVFAYNFSDFRVKGFLRVEAPQGWKATLPTRVEIAPQSRTELLLQLDCRESEPTLLGTIRVEGDFGRVGKSVLSLRLVPEPSLIARQVGTSIPEASKASRWEGMAAGEGRVRLAQRGDWVTLEAEPQGPDKWVYAVLKLPTGQRPLPGTIGLGCTLMVEEGEGVFRTIFDEQNGSSYVSDFSPQLRPSAQAEVIALFDPVTHGTGWSKPDANGRLDPEDIVAFKVGCNLKTGRARLAFKNLRWLHL